MGTINDYVREETRSFQELPFNEVDALILATLLYEDVANLSPALILDESDDADSFTKRLRAFQPKHPLTWLRGLVETPFNSMSMIEADLRFHPEDAAFLQSQTASDEDATTTDSAHADAVASIASAETAADQADDVAAPNENTADAPDSDATAAASTEPTEDSADTTETEDGSLHKASHPDHEPQIVSIIDTNPIHSIFGKTAFSQRFGGMRIGAVAEHNSSDEQTQFAAATFRLPDGPHTKDPTRGGTLVISFRGTDDSLVGWKEDFNMAFQYPVPAQRAASAYLDTVAKRWHGPIILTGHSKGGNLAIYAAMNADSKVQERIQHIYSLDGPGFPAHVVKSPAYLNVQPKVTKVVPSSSMVGMILETPEECMVVSSNANDMIMQHSAHSWQIEGDSFVLEPGISSSSQYFNESLNTWLQGLTTEQRERSVDALFKVIQSNGARSFNEVMKGFPRSVPSMLGAFVGLTSDERKHITEALTIFLKTAMGRRQK